MGSGFMAHAIESLKRNRRLLHEKTNRFKQKTVTKRINRTKKKQKHNTEYIRKLRLADKKRQNSIKLQIGLIAFIAIIGTILLLQWGNEALPSQLKTYTNSLKNIELEAADAKRKERYFTLIKWGDYYLNNQKWEAAQNSFDKALKFFPNGKKVNLGLTKSLIYRCKFEQKYCEASITYFNSLKQSNSYSETTIKQLSLLIQD